MVDVREVDELRAENARLRRSLDDLEAEKRGLVRLIQATIDQVDAVIYLRDATGIFTYVNETYVRVTGFARESVIGKRDCDVFPRAVYEAFRVADREVEETRRVVEEEEELPQRDGLHVFRSLKFPVLGDDGSWLGLGGISTDLTSQRRAETSLLTTQLILQAIIDNAPVFMAATDREGRYILVSRAVAQQMGRPPEEIVGRLARELLPTGLAESLEEQAGVVFRTGQPLVVEERVDHEGAARTLLSTRFPIRDGTGTVYAVGSITTDVTEVRGAEEERLRLQQEVIRAQQSALQELSTPIVPIAEGVLAVPLIGSLDRERMQQIVSTVLHRISGSRAAIVILDLTGVRQIDTATVNALLQTARAIRLLGVETVLTGIQPDTAQTMVGLDVPLQQVTTLQTLQRGIEYALARLRKDRSAR